MNTFSLRPVSHSDRSSSPSTSTASDRTPPPFHDARPPHALPSARTMPGPRGPSSPSLIEIRGVNLPSDNSNPGPRKYPAPPTGHELMALFPPAPPVTFTGGPTSGYFQKEERAFFAQAGKEIVRVRIEVDMTKDNEGDSPRSRPPRDASSVPRSWLPPNAPQPPQLRPPQPPPMDAHPAPFPPQSTLGRVPRNALPGMPTHSPAMPHNSPHPQFPPNVHPSPNTQHGGFALRTSPHERPHPSEQGASESLADEFRDDPDEAWRRPIPHNQRRRAGKHTKRVVVK